MSASLGQDIESAVAAVRRRSDLVPRAGLVLGTGLGDVTDAIRDAVSVPYEEIPGFPTATVESHAGLLVLGKVKDTPVAAMKGRLHYYEGYSMKEVTFPIRVLRGLGAKTLILSAAAGGMNPSFRLGDIMVVSDHLNLMPENPLVGPNDDTLGPRFPDMSAPYSRRLRELAEEIALEERMPLREGVFAGVPGPNLETRAEYRFLRTIGADAVSMSLIPETLVAVHGGMDVLAFTVITDLCFPDALEPVDIARILAVAASAEPALRKLVTRVLERM